MVRVWMGAAATAAALALAGCGKGAEAEAVSPVAAVEAAGVAPATGEPVSEAGQAQNEAGVEVKGAAVSVQDSYVKGAGPEWAVQIDGKNLGEGFDGLEYKVELLDEQQRMFATHASQMWFTPAIAADEALQWAARLPVQDGQPEPEGVTARVTVLKRLSKEALTEGTWKPLDPNNLPPPREVKLDANGNVIGDAAEATERLRG